MINQDLTIDSLATLTITDTLLVNNSSTIIVRPGGKLVVDGGTLTSACPNEMWQGIEVVGDRTKRQLSRYQGTVELRNGATIENAHCAIRTGLREDEAFLTTGGIIKADSAFFINNRRSVELLSYTNHTSTGAVADNLGHFKRCLFTVDDNNLFSQNNASFIDHVTMWDVRGVEFNGCSFSNLTSDALSFRRHAIYTADAGFKVDAYCRANYLVDCECPAGYSRYCTFTGFNTAVEANTDGTQYAVNINHAFFDNNYTAMKVNGNNFTTVTRCKVDLQQVPGLSMSNKGLVLNTCTGYKVEKDTFRRSTYTDPLNFSSRGIEVDSSGSAENSIHLNDFENLGYGIYVRRNNGNQSAGLQATCNGFTNNKYDIYMAANATMNYLQGSSTKGADNRFSTTSNNVKNFHNPGTPYINYYCYNGNPNLYPFHSTGLTISTVKISNPCASTLCNNGGGFNKSLSEFQSDMDADTYYESVRALMSDSVLDLTALEEWHTAAQPIADPYSLTETRFMEGYAEMFAAAADDAELSNYAEFHAMKLALRNGDGSVGANNYSPLQSGHINWYALTPAQIAQLQTIAERNTGRASVMAKGVLCFFFGICYEDEFEADNQDTDTTAAPRAKHVAMDGDGDAELTVHPNPTDDMLYIELSGAGIANSALYDLQGRLVYSQNSSNSPTLSLKSVPAGVYLLRVTDTDGREYHQKIVKK